MYIYMHWKDQGQAEPHGKEINRHKCMNEWWQRTLRQRAGPTAVAAAGDAGRRMAAVHHDKRADFYTRGGARSRHAYIIVCYNLIIIIIIIIHACVCVLRSSDHAADDRSHHLACSTCICCTFQSAIEKMILSFYTFSDNVWIRLCLAWRRASTSRDETMHF